MRGNGNHGYCKRKAVHTINGEEQYLEEGDIIAGPARDSHGIAQTGDEPLVLIAQVLFA